MAWTIKDKAGNCCGCAERFDPCDCGTPCTGIECQTRGGVAQICGHAEYIASDPVRRYKLETRRRSWSWPLYSDAACSVPLPPEGLALGVVVELGSLNWTVNVSWQFRNNYTEVRPLVGGVATLSSTRGGQLLIADVAVVSFNEIGASFGGATSDALWQSVGAGVWTLRCTITEEFDADAVLASGTRVVTFPGFPANRGDEEQTRRWDAECEALTVAGDDVADLAVGGSCALTPVATTATRRDQDPTGACCDRGDAGPGREHAVAADFVDELSEEDTEELAIERLRAATAWSGWSGQLSACVAAWQAREGDSTFFVYQDARWRATISVPAPAPGTPLPWPAVEREVRVRFERRPFGEGEFQLFATHEEKVLVTPGTPWVIEGDVPNTRGWETKVAGCVNR